MVALHPSMLPMTMPPMMPAAVIAGTAVIGERRTNYSAIAVAVIYWRIIVIVRISAVAAKLIGAPLWLDDDENRAAFC